MLKKHCSFNDAIIYAQRFGFSDGRFGPYFQAAQREWERQAEASQLLTDFQI